MYDWKILFVGIGSIAKRHIKNIWEVIEEQGNKCRIDAFRSNGFNKLGSDTEQYLTNVYYEEKHVPTDYDIIFITNPTEFHLETLMKFHDKGKNFFIEKPLCSVRQLETLQLDFLRENSVYYVASPLRFTAVVQYVKNNIDINDVLSVRSISSSYLPEWRPDTDYRKSYSANKNLGGGVAIDLIHEWDYLFFLFGRPYKVYAIMKHVSELEIDTEDIAIYIAEYDNMVAELHLDYLGRYPVRKLEIFMKEDTVVCDLINSTVRYMKNGKIIDFHEERNAYQKEEIRFFLKQLQENVVNKEKLLEAVEVLKLTGGN